jgi:A/G-specific adenine glycosylase
VKAFPPALPSRTWFIRRLRPWFRDHARDLPWRRTRDSYAIWVSEVMLQQTQVATVIPFFERFLTAFPTLADLARAKEHDVLRLWEGLGYYRRARHLHRAAQAIVADHGGELPRDPDTLRRLPGFGRYTAGAVLSQAFDAREPILEANSRRVLCRWLGYRRDPRSTAGQKYLWRAAHSLLPRTGVGDFNQALMELGALVCTARNPRCDACPLHARCAARRLNLQERIPREGKAKLIEEVEEVAVVPRRRGRVLLLKRPDHGRWAGLWEFPHGPIRPGESHTQAAERVLKEMTGLAARVGTEVLTIRHGIMRYRITMTCIEAECGRGNCRSGFHAESRWIGIDDLPSFPVSSPQRRLAKSLVPLGSQKVGVPV